VAGLALHERELDYDRELQGPGGLICGKTSHWELEHERIHCIASGDFKITS